MGNLGEAFTAALLAAGASDQRTSKIYLILRLYPECDYLSATNVP